MTPRRELWLLLTLAGIQFSHVLDFMILMPLGPQLNVIFGINDAQFGLLVSAYTLAAGASGLMASLYIDRFGRKRLLLALYVLFAGATLACGLAPGYGFLLGARIAAGLFGGVLAALVQTIVGDIIPFERRGRAMGVVMTSFSVSTVAGVPLGLFLAAQLGWHAPFFLIAGPCVIESEQLQMDTAGTLRDMARELGIPRDKWVFLHGCADAHDHWHVTERRDYHSSPAMAGVFAQAFEMAGKSLSDVAAFDIYSCFASAVHVACQALGLPQDDARGLTVTGGLPYFGGPGNNYVTHSIAEMVQRVRATPGRLGLVTANGNYLTKHSAGLYSTEAPIKPFAPQDPAILQARLDSSVPKPPFAELAEGSAQIETYTVSHDGKGPSNGVVIGRLDDGTRFIANTPADAALWAEMETVDFLGRRGRVASGPPGPRPRRGCGRGSRSSTAPMRGGAAPALPGPIR